MDVEEEEEEEEEEDSVCDEFSTVSDAVSLAQVAEAVSVDEDDVDVEDVCTEDVSTRGCLTHASLLRCATASKMLPTRTLQRQWHVAKLNVGSGVRDEGEQPLKLSLIHI